ncbi:MAG: acyloxyacyl hydrolase [Bacteroidaceae bacterium]|nr:acyloxyacyl hydrolase [Bacteroidaceae bacterium]
MMVSVSFVPSYAEDADSVIVGSAPKFLYSVGGSAGINHLLNIEMRGEKLVKRGWGSNYGLYFDWQANPLDTAISVYDRVFGFPTLEAGVQLLDYSHTRLHTGDTPYQSRVGYVWTAYVGFRRDIYRNRKWSFGYGLENGLTYCSRPYEAHSNLDNDMIGQHLSLYFGFGVYAGYRVTPQTELSIGLEYKHVSNGATDRPNKGSNSYGVTMRGRCDLNRPNGDRGLTFEQRLARLQAFNRKPFESFMYLDIDGSVGFRTLYEEWLLHRDYLPEGAPGYHDGKLGLHTVWSAELVPMFRYNQVHASGLGLEYTFAGYTPHSAMIEKEIGLEKNYSHSKHVLGIAAHHEVFYKHLSLAMSLGTYLFRQHGWIQGESEPAIYETIGIRYYPSFFRPFYIGYNVKANLGRAYDMEIKVGIHAGHWRLKKKK